jgi:hypothetical protein
MFTYIPTNYMLSSALNLCLSAGGQIGQIERFLAPLRSSSTSPNPDAWTHAWDTMATQQATLADEDVKNRYFQSASARHLRCSTYSLTGERETPPGEAKMRTYKAALETFGNAVRYMRVPIERVEVPSPDGILPGYLIPSGKMGKSPVVIFCNGFDVTKEILYAIIRDEFANRGIACLVIDTPGTGEPLRLRNVASRPDYEVPTSVVVDYLETRQDIDREQIGLVGISPGLLWPPWGGF